MSQHWVEFVGVPPQCGVRKKVTCKVVLDNI